MILGAPQPEWSIGLATLQPDRTLVLDLRVEPSLGTQAPHLTYAPSSPVYGDMPRHLGAPPMRPGGVRFIRPFD